MKRRFQIFLLGLLLLAGAVIAQENYTVRFYQPSPTEDDSYQVQMYLENGWTFLDLTAVFVDPCEDCEQLIVMIPDDGLLRLRRFTTDIFGEVQFSAWTDPIMTPEPGTALMLGVGALGLVALARRR